MDIRKVIHTVLWGAWLSRGCVIGLACMMPAFCRNNDSTDNYRVERSFYEKTHLLWFLFFFYSVYLIGFDRFFYLYMLELRPWKYHAFFVLIFFALGIFAIQNFLKGKNCRAGVFFISALVLLFTGMVDTGLNHVDVTNFAFGIIASLLVLGAVIFWRHITTFLLWGLFATLGWMSVLYLGAHLLEGEEGMIIFVSIWDFCIAFPMAFLASALLHIVWWHIKNKPLPKIVYKVAKISIVALGLGTIPVLTLVTGTFSEDFQRPENGLTLLLFFMYVWALPMLIYWAASISTSHWFEARSFNERIVRPSILIGTPIIFVLMIILPLYLW